MSILSVDIEALDPGATLLAPVGMTTPHDAIKDASVSGGRIAAALLDPELALCAVQIVADGGPLRLTYRLGDASATGSYPEQMFVERHNRFTQAAGDLAEASRKIAQGAGGGSAGIAALVAEAESRFDYGHPETRFNDGADAVPYLSCGLTPGSCVDINTYLIASLRACGYEAGYVYGYFFPEENGGVTHDMHCWVVTRHDGCLQEWDIAHHVKAGLGPTQAGLNPRPGRRVALGHSMGHRYAAPGLSGQLKLLAEPMRLVAGDLLRVELVARLQG
ncbi:MAG: transglutaminase-like domain-containing protein [Pseudomonadota bacterium]|uniref:transglutaminase-like domain-containing protein n=1 Tax=Roseovarius TaxID=74030 RepID=UPI0022A8B631|nr:transglutaminase-like domain-containing protein [Roseovarius sp. EGI FJ00037]MCZ0813771.1 transglutaminase-like domain-containing protein [Roseovarius sp. EGI FJ00037]